MKILNLAVLDIEKVNVVGFFLCEILRPRAHFTFGILDQATAEDLHALIEVLDCEDHAWSTSQGLNFSASIVELGDESLNFREFGHDIKMAIRVHS